MMKQKYVYILVFTILTACLTLFAACNTVQTQEPTVEHTLSFCVDGTVINTQQISPNHKAVMPQEPAKVGYIFNGWFLDDGVWSQLFTQDTLADKQTSINLTVYAKYTPVKYELIFEPGKEIEHSNPAEYTVEQHVELLPATKQHYTFVGWFTDAELTEQIYEIPAGMTGPMTFYAKFEPTQYKAVFMDGETVVGEVPYTIESKRIVPPAVPERPGYVGEWESFELLPGGFVVNAKYATVDYKITYEGVKKSEHENPAGFDVTQLPITLQDAVREHYIFDGWYTDAEYTNRLTEITPDLTTDLTLYAKWTPVEYTATFMDGENVIAVVPYTVETESITPPEVPEHAGYAGEWEEFELTPGGITVNAVYELLDYEIIYEGVTSDEHENPNGYNVTEQPIALGDAVREHYVFEGWYTDEAFTERLPEIAPGMTGDLVLYAKWTPVEYTATFMDGETVVGQITFTVETESITPPEVPEHAGYEGEWDEFELIPEDFAVDAVYAQIYYKITYENTKDAAHGNPKTYTVSTETILLGDLYKAGYTFNGWYVGGNRVTEIAQGSTGDVVLTASWTPIVYTINLHFDPAQGAYADAGNPATYTVENLILLKDLVSKKTGYVFDGWYTAKNVGEGYRVTEIALGSTGNVELYAHFVPAEYTITYVGLEDAINLNPGFYTIESADVNILPAYREGFVFGGWFTDPALSVPASLLIPTGSTGNVTLYTKWTPITYVIEYDGLGGTLPENPAVYNTTQTLTFAEPTKTGYMFKGWFTAKEAGEQVTEVLPGTTGNLKLYARWEAIYYSITYHLYGGENAQMNLPLYTIELPTMQLLAATKPGYKFEGWYADPAYSERVLSVPQGSYGDLVLYAKWSLETYQIHYELPAGAKHENITQYTVLDDLKPLNPASWTGYVFAGWYKDADFKHAVTHVLGAGTYGNLTLYAKFIPKQYSVWLGSDKENSYTLTFDLNGGVGENFTQTITMEQGITFPAIPTRAGYLFAGWYDNAECKGELFDMSVPVTKDQTLYAKWVQTAASISINAPINVTLAGVTEQKYTFVPLTDSVVTITTAGGFDTRGILYDAKGNVLATNDDASDADKNFRITYHVTAGKEYTVSVYGYSNAVQGTAQLSVTGYATVSAGGKAYLPNLRVISSGEQYVLPVPAARPYYKFLGWKDEKGNLYTDGNGVCLKAWDTDADVVLTESWKELLFTVSFDVDGGSEVASFKLHTGKPLDVSKTVPIKKGYRFMGWTLNGQPFATGVMPEGDVVLVANWKELIVTLNYDASVTAVSALKELTAETFGATCTDNFGGTYTVALTYEGKFEAGQTIKVTLSVRNAEFEKEVVLAAIKVYGAPVITYNPAKTDLSIADVDMATKTVDLQAIDASAKDSFGNALSVTAVLLSEKIEPDQPVIVRLQATDALGQMSVLDVICKVIDLKDGPVVHTHDWAKAVTAPTCTEKGYTTYTCACGESKKEDYVDATGHTEVVDAAVAATCTEAGLTEGKHCSVCKTVLVAQETVKAKGHTEVVDAAVAATCTKTGLTEGKHCLACKAVLVAQETVKVTDHTPGEWVVDKEATGTEAGKHHQICSVCGATLKEEVIPALGKQSDYTVDDVIAWRQNGQTFEEICQKLEGEGYPRTELAWILREEYSTMMEVQIFLLQYGEPGVKYDQAYLLNLMQCDAATLKAIFS